MSLENQLLLIIYSRKLIANEALADSLQTEITAELVQQLAEKTKIVEIGAKVLQIKEETPLINYFKVEMLWILTNLSLSSANTKKICELHMGILDVLGELIQSKNGKIYEQTLHLIGNLTGE